ncbi:unnamed protein product [Cuscuta epithymum]|uniref:Uncharacterized protein n=1 Tax=Cuscuta epithymum TaxID=186058 RepID=A0AAV0FTP2_9ASTE|nr:unnamed protein product [Cuscuta epithymum]
MLPSFSSSLPFPPFNHRKSRETSVNKSTAACATLSSFLQHESSSSSLSSCSNQKTPSVHTQKPSSSSSSSSSTSRYKLKGIGSRQVVVEETDEKVAATPPPAAVTATAPSPGHAFISDLLDKYEVHRISLLLDHYIETSCDDRRRPGNGKSGRSNVKKKPPLPPVGLWLMRQTSLCGSRTTDVVEESTARIEIGGCSSSRWLLRR